MKINLNLIKEGIKTAKTMVIGSVPILFVGKYCLDEKRYQDALATVRINKLNGYPTTLEEYKEWSQTAPAEEVEKYNDVLASVKAKDEISDALMQKSGVGSNSEFHDLLKTLFEQGKAGNLQAQEQFNSLYQSYQDDMFYQTAMDIDVPLPEVPILPDGVVVPPSDGSKTDLLSTSNIITIAAIGIVGVCLIGYGIHKYLKNKNKSNMLTKEK